MKTLSVLVALGIAATGTASFAQAVEDGYPRGSLAVAAIERGDWARAEQLLNGPLVDRDDPARLINLGQVYLHTGRQAEALAAFRAALASNRHVDVGTLSGRFVSTRQIAREVLARYETAQLGTR
ncbi:tetratricopeptide repeat protein [Sphingosinicella sp.]|uniref:tetratricopeptide repeat protein n=1 Tax=Sphingosinicella sp. TaxID=1917971 RepID=UPI004038406D